MRENRLLLLQARRILCAVRLPQLSIRKTIICEHQSHQNHERETKTEAVACRKNTAIFRCLRLVHKLIFQPFRGISVGAMIFGILAAAVAYVGAIVDLNSPIYGATDVVEKIRQLKIDAIWFGVAVFFIMIACPRPAFLKRAPLAILAACFSWLIASRFLFYCVYEQLHTQGIDLNKVLQGANPQ